MAVFCSRKSSFIYGKKDFRLFFLFSFYFKLSQFLPIRILNFDKYNKTTDVYIKNLTIKLCFRVIFYFLSFFL